MTRRRRTRWGWLLGATLVIAACRKDEAPAYPPGLKPSPAGTSTLTPDHIARITRIQARMAEVDPTPLPKLLEDFSRDAHPEREIAIWEAIADAYERFAPGRSIEAKREAFGLLLVRSASPEADVVKQPRKVLTEVEVTELLRGYTAAPQPIQVKPAQ